MRYDITIGKKTRSVDIERGESSPENYSLKLQDQYRKSNLVILKREPAKLIVSIDDKVYSISQVRRSLASVIYVVNGKLIRAQIRGEPAPESSSSIASISEIVTSKLPAKVVKVNAHPGDLLNEGDSLILLETMKMEVQIAVPRKCQVKEVLVSEGENVTRGKELMILKFV